MHPRRSTSALVAASLGLGASLASLVDYVAPAPTFCAASGCETVRASAWAHPLGVPMPIFGVVFFGAMIALAFVARPRLRLALAIAGGAWALALIGVQAFAIGAWCKLCLVSDASALALALAVVAGAAAVPLTWARALVGGGIAIALPLGFAIVTAAGEDEPEAATADAATPAVPAVVAHAQTTGAVTVMEFVDFECPFCRRLAPELASAVSRAAGPVTVIRKMVPLPMHRHARTAALAWSCADAQGKGDAMADALFAAPPDSLTPEGCEQLAAQIGCDVDRYRHAFADPATSARVDADLADAKAAGADALPTIFIGTERFTGANHSADELLAAIDHAK